MNSKYFNFKDYIDYCKMTNQKPSHYKSLQDYRRFLEVTINFRKFGGI